jgi:hypothetical protein
MDVFTVGLFVLFAVTAIFFIVLFSFIYYWHLKKVTFFVVPAVFTFEFFIMGLFLVVITALIIQFLPELIRIAGMA